MDDELLTREQVRRFLRDGTWWRNSHNPNLPITMDQAEIDLPGGQRVSVIFLAGTEFTQNPVVLDWWFR